MNGWTIEDAATLLHPAMSADEIRDMIALFDIRPDGVRRTGRCGRPVRRTIRPLFSKRTPW